MAARAEGFPKLCSGFVWPRWPCSEPVTKILSWNVNQNCTHMFPIMRSHCVLNGNMTFLRYTYYLVFFLKFHKNIFGIWRTCSDKWHERGVWTCARTTCVRVNVRANVCMYEWAYVRAKVWAYVCAFARSFATRARTYQNNVDLSRPYFCTTLPSSTVLVLI